MKVRDLTKRVNEYKGHTIEAPYEVCPCMPCWNVHDCGYSHPQTHEWVEMWDCATRYNGGCPDIHTTRAIHIIKFVPIEKRKGKVVKCLRCGLKFKLGEGKGIQWKMLE